MSLLKVSEEKNEVGKEIDPPSPEINKKRKLALEEEEYVTAMGAIIERDFYPDLSEMRKIICNLQKEETQLQSSGILFSSQQSDTNKINVTSEVTSKTPYLTARHANLIETPYLKDSDNVSMRGFEGMMEQKYLNGENFRIPKQSLDHFLSTYTSEDNASFEEIQENTVEKRKSKYQHLLEVNDVKLIKLDKEKSKTDGYGTTGQNPDTLIGWNFVPQNKLFYDSAVTGVAEYSVKEVEKRVHGPPKQIKHINTRFPINDGEEIASNDNDLTNITMENNNKTKKYYEMIRTPLSEMKTPVTGMSDKAMMMMMTPGFVIKDASERDKAARAMATKAYKSLSRRANMRTPMSTSSNLFGMNSSKKLSSAALKLASSFKSKDFDMDLQLRAGYSGKYNYKGTYSSMCKGAARTPKTLMEKEKKRRRVRDEAEGKDNDKGKHKTDGLLQI